MCVKVTLVFDIKCCLFHFPAASKGPFTNTFKGEGWRKKGALKIWKVWKEDPEKIMFFLPLKLSIWFSVGLTTIFLGDIRGALKNFWGAKGGGLKIFHAEFFFFASGPPYKCLWTVPKEPENNL